LLRVRRDSGAWHGVAFEVRPFSLLYTLLMWPVLFAPIPDVFRFMTQRQAACKFVRRVLLVNRGGGERRGPYCDRPLDIKLVEFYPSRKQLIQERCVWDCHFVMPRARVARWSCELIGTLRDDARRLDWLCGATREELVRIVGDVYRENYMKVIGTVLALRWCSCKPLLRAASVHWAAPDRVGYGPLEDAPVRARARGERDISACER
jgi:hypothetical protein